MASHRHPYLDTPGPIAFAHRGGSDVAPENTLAAFAAAIDLGYTYLETDVHLAADGTVVAFHDDRLQRVTDRAGLIAELSMPEIRAADAGYRFSSDGVEFPFRGKGIGVPSLHELLSSWPQARFNIDVKSDAVVEPLLTLLARTNSLSRVCVGSFSDQRLRQARELRGAELCTSMGPRQLAGARLTSLFGGIRDHSSNCLQIPRRRRGIPMATPGLIRAAHHAGLAVHVWTINDGVTAARLLDHGADGLMTDRPEMLRDLFAARGLRVDGSRAPAAAKPPAPPPAKPPNGLQ